MRAPPLTAASYTMVLYQPGCLGEFLCVDVCVFDIERERERKRAISPPPPKRRKQMQVDLPPARRGCVSACVDSFCRTLDFCPNMDTYFISSSICCSSSLGNATAIAEFDLSFEKKMFWSK